jgi:hypothetical protein
MTADEIIEELKKLVGKIEATQTHNTVPEILYAWDMLRKRVDRIQANPVDYRHETMADKEYINWIETEKSKKKNFRVDFLYSELNPGGKTTFFIDATELDAAVELAKEEFQKTHGFWPNMPLLVEDQIKKERWARDL